MPAPTDVSRRVRWRQPSFAIWFPLAVYATTRLIDALFIVIAARHQTALAGIVEGYHVSVASGAHPGYRGVATNWDGQWYLSIAAHGYPTTMPRDAGGHVLQNEWGFYPVYPFLAGALMRISGLGFPVVAPLLSFLLGAAAVTVMFRLLRETSGRFTASATVLLTCTYMAAASMQIAYTESLALLLLCTCLLLLRHRRYGWLVPLLITLALTRAVALAFVPVVIVHGIYRYRHHDREPFPAPERWRVAGLAVLCVAATGLWPAIAAVATGHPGAYTQTMSAWGGTTGQLGVLIQFPLRAWSGGGVLGLAVLFFVIALTAGIVLRRGAAVWGPEVRAWAGFYPLYLLLATAAGPSTIRHLLLAFPLLWPFPEEAASRSEGRRRVALVVALAICGLVLQWVWISGYLVVAGPPGGHPFP